MVVEERLLLRSNGPSAAGVLSRAHSYGVCAIPAIARKSDAHPHQSLQLMRIEG
jgi:hypothetical protein